jgi:hypothetical protein
MTMTPLVGVFGMGVFLVDLGIVDRLVGRAFDHGGAGNRVFGRGRRDLAFVTGAFGGRGEGCVEDRCARQRERGEKQKQRQTLGAGSLQLEMRRKTPHLP